MAEQAKKKRGYRRVPRYALEECVRALREAVSNVGDSPVSGETLANALGYATRNGTSDAKIGSLTHYGLYDSGGGEYSVTDLGRRILYPVDGTDSKEALAEAVQQPTVFRELFDTYAGSRLPELLSNILVQKFNVNPRTAGDVAECFLESVRFAGLLEGRQLLPDPSVDSDTTAATSGTDAGRDDEPRLVPKHAVEIPSSASTSSNATVSGYAIPLAGGKSAILSLPIPVTAEDVSRIRGWIDLMEPVLTEKEDGAARAPRNDKET